MGPIPLDPNRDSSAGIGCDNRRGLVVVGCRLPRNSPREVRPFWMRVKSVWERVRSVLEGGAVVEEPRWTGGGGCRRMRDTDLPLRPCDRWHLRAWEALWEDMHDRSGPGRRSYPCAARGTSVYPK